MKTISKQIEMLGVIIELRIGTVAGLPLLNVCSSNLTLKAFKYERNKEIF